ncbi:MAG: S8 family peptidase [Acidimicrobiales bacterium]
MASVFVVSAFIALLPPAGTAQPAPGGPSASPLNRALSVDGLDGESYTVTLITGDRVLLTAAGGDRYSVTVEPAPRADGTTPVIQVTQGEDGLYALPDDVLAPVAAGRLDEELFNVAYLAANGYADEASGQLPVIVGYADETGPAAVAHAVDGLAASSRTVTLESVNAAGVRVDKADAGAFWASLRGAQSPTGVNGGQGSVLSGGIERVWLDRMVSVALDESVPQIGAPEAWGAGYDGSGIRVCVIDTGIDTAHPDVADKVVASESFVPGEEVADGHGHGTHVASTVAGIGAASGGQYTGVAPGAELVIAKGLSNAGSGFESQIIEAMEWCAIDQGTDIVSMSLSGSVTNGTDPMSQAVNDLTASTGTLFVIAAGNYGRPFTVGTPGAASAALTVGAVDKSDVLAGFSSRGPRLGDHALKPEITGPGVAITAARAAGTDMGGGAEPVDDFYITASGTSMATPHVAGAAAIVAQAHPDWAADDLKAALVATTVDGGYTVYEQGAGRVDVARAVTQQVQVAPATADFGLIPEDQEEPPAPKAVTYTNPTDTAITLELAVTAERVDGTPVPDGTVAVEPATVEVAAGGTATATVTVDHTDLGPALYSGRVVVADDTSGTQLVTPVGFAVGERLHQVSVRIVPRSDGHVIPQAPLLWLFRVGDVGSPPYLQFFPIPEGGADIFVPAGIFFAHVWVWWADDANRAQIAYLLAPEVTVAGDTDLVLDANAAEKITIDTPRTSETFTAVLEHRRTAPDPTQGVWTGLFTSYGSHNFWATPTEPVTAGTFQLASDWVMGAPPVSMTVTRPERLALHPVYAGGGGGGGTGYPPAEGVRFSGRRSMSVVYAGRGGEEDYAGRDVHGKLALVRPEQPEGFCEISDALLNNAIAAGAAGVLLHPEDCLLPVWRSGPQFPDIPVASLPASEADTLIDLLGRASVTINVADNGATPYLYQLKFYEDARVPESMHYTVAHGQLVQIDASYHADQPVGFNQIWGASRPDEFITGATSYDFDGPTSRREFIGPLPPDTAHYRVTCAAAREPESPFCITSPTAATETSLDIFADHRARQSEHWNPRPRVPGAPDPPIELIEAQPGKHTRTWVCSGCRQGDRFYPHTYLAAADPDHAGKTIGWQPATVHLYRDAQEIPQADPFLGQVAVYELPPEPAQYRLTLDHENTNTAWHFGSSSVTSNDTPPGFVCLETIYLGSTTPCRPEPLIYLRYDPGVGLDNAVPAPGSHELQVTAYHHGLEGPAITGMRLWVSTDSGARWRRAQVTDLGEGVYATTITVPDVGRTSGTVSIRAEARDADGNHVYQTVYDAYGLTQLAPTGGGPGSPQAQ